MSFADHGNGTRRRPFGCGFGRQIEHDAEIPAFRPVAGFKFQSLLQTERLEVCGQDDGQTLQRNFRPGECLPIATALSRSVQRQSPWYPSPKRHTSPGTPAVQSRRTWNTCPCPGCRSPTPAWPARNRGSSSTDPKDECAGLTSSCRPTRVSMSSIAQATFLAAGIFHVPLMIDGLFSRGQ